jgi:hypothetical protein
MVTVSFGVHGIDLVKILPEGVKRTQSISKIQFFGRSIRDRVAIGD